MESICQLPDGLAIKATPEQVHIISDPEQGLNVLSRALLLPGDTVFVERPASQRARAAFLARHAKIIEMPMAKDGPDFRGLEALLKRQKPKLFYVMPNYQQPLGICYSEESKHRLLEIAYSHGAYIIEEDQQGDFFYNGERRTPLKALDYEGRVIYMKSFARVLTPGIGVGFMVCPSRVPEIKPDISPPGYMQRVFDFFLRNGDFEAHAANMRRAYGRRYHKLAAAVSAYLTPLADFKLTGGGLSLWVTPRGGRNSNDIANKLLQRKVLVSPGCLFAADLPGFRISFAAVPEERIAEGIGVIASVLAGE